jgi:hypothetical protein
MGYAAVSWTARSLERALGGRFGSVVLDADRIGRDTSKIVEDVVS